MDLVGFQNSSTYIYTIKIKVMTTINKTSPCVSDIHLYTKMKQDGNLYQSISDMVGTLRKAGFEDIDIKEFILKFTTRIIDEQ
jgi:hypothetical protein